MSASGLPQLPAGVSVFTDAVLLVSDAISVVFASQAKWGIFLDGEPVVLADNVVKFGYSQDWIVSEYPQEQGAFASYNKAAKPFEIKLRFSTGGSVVDRQNFLQSIAEIAGDTNLYDIATPEIVYSSCNIIHQDYDRDASNAGLVSVDVWVKQINIAGAATFSNTRSPTDASQANGGLVQGSVVRGPDLPNISGPLNYQ